MRYSELIQFEPIQSVKVLRDADQLERATEDVRTFVISHRMADQLVDVIVPTLQFAIPGDNRGLLVVANYGTGKTHLMSVIAAVSEHKDLVGELTNPEVAKAFQQAAGNFRVIRAEIGATRMGLRDIVCTELSKGLERLGVDFTFPDVASITNNKDALTDMMAAFESVHPARGLLFVLDELLDYLRKRRDAELIEDLQFLREVGEVCGSIRFRFVAGVQEALFDNPRFTNVASDMSRVKDRFAQVRISREDVAFVVKERLLRKSVSQRDSIRAHLQPFTPLYEGMAENLDEFVALFPVHPAFLRTFEGISAIEKREILKTLSAEMNAILEEEVPNVHPGLVCYDRYRARMVDDPSVRSIPEVREVLDKSGMLRTRVEKAMPSKHFVPVAQRIIDALAVHRLTTEDIYTPIGATRRELCDDLCLLPEGLPERDAAFLELTVASVIDEIVKAVSGQFITEDQDTGQVYLDLKKNIDYDQKIEDRATSLDDDRLDEGYFRALETLLERTDVPYVAGYLIWAYELPWRAKNVTRLGYLFMGAPNERSTAQPPRDFYLYFIQPYNPPKPTWKQGDDEVLLRLEQPDEAFTTSLRRYAGATALAMESTAANRSIYDEKATVALREMIVWLRKNMGEAVTVTYKDETKVLREWLGTVTPGGTVKDQIDMIAATALASHFEDRYPGYPRFSVTVTRANLVDTVLQALSHIATGRSTRASTSVLESLGLLNLQGELVTNGELARELLTAVSVAGGKVVNRSDLLMERDPGVATWPPRHLEPTWVTAIAAALTQLGKLEIGFPPPIGQVDALALDRLTKMTPGELGSFSHLAPPKTLPVLQLRDVAKLLNLPPGSISDGGADAGVVTAILPAATTALNRITEARASVRDGLALWGAPVLEQPDERDQRLEAAQRLLENVKARNTVGKMNRLEVAAEELEAARVGMAELVSVEAAVAARTKLIDVANFLQEAANTFGPAFDLSVDAATLRTEILELFRQDKAADVSKVTELRIAADDLRRRFAEAAERAITHDTLDGTGDNRKRKLLEGDTYRTLKKLAAVSLLPGGLFGSLEKQLVDLPVCKAYQPADLLRSIVLPDTSYRPRVPTGPSAAARLASIEEQLDDLRANWEQTLLDNLSLPDLRERVQLLGPPGRPIEDFLAAGVLPNPVTDEFVKALDDVLKGFDVHRISAGEIWQALFPDKTPATVAQLRQRFANLIDELRKGANEEKVRVVPTEQRLEG